jgi:hypothetical protein
MKQDLWFATKDQFKEYDIPLRTVPEIYDKEYKGNWSCKKRVILN